MNIGNIDKFRNEAIGDFKRTDVGHDLFRGSLSKSYCFLIQNPSAGGNEKLRQCYQILYAYGLPILANAAVNFHRDRFRSLILHLTTR